MRTLPLLMIILVLVGCGGDDDSNTNNCGCTGIIGKRYYINVSESFIDDCNFIDEMEYLENGRLNLYRSGGGFNEELMSEIMSYEITDTENCKLRFFDFDESKQLEEPNCSGSVSLSVIFGIGGNGEASANYTNVDCGEYTIGSITHVDYYPR